MAGNGDPLFGGSYSEILFPGEEMMGFQDSSAGIFAAGDLVNPSDVSQKMLCFGDYENKCDLTLPLKSEITCNNNNSSATSCANNGKIKNKRTGIKGEADGGSLSTGAGAPAKKRRENGHAKVKKGKEKLGERISALQQLVSPFGKTDTASVLHETMGYIKFLQEQVQVLCSPYLQTPLSSSNQVQLHGDGNIRENEQMKDIKSKGLCLVPMEAIMHNVPSTNGADLWSPAAAMKKNAASDQY